MRLTIVGNTVIDLVFPDVSRLPTWPRHTEFTSKNLVLLKRPPVVTLGGNGANAAFVAASCGAEVTLVTQLGRDALGTLATGWLRQAGCRVVPADLADASAVNVTAANTTHARATFFYPGLRPRLTGVTPPGGRGALLVCGWPHPPMAEMARRFRLLDAAGGLTALDTGPLLGPVWTLAELRPVLSSLRLLLSNEFELKAITRARTLALAVRRMRGYFAGDLVVKRGAAGALWYPAHEELASEWPAARVSVVSTIGAGDAFNGALLAQLCRGAGFPVALRFANRVAGQAVSSRQGVLGVRGKIRIPTRRGPSA
ncbi:MAG: carbohydrate kinase family protein [Opitutaceae bacterium]|nr:carbohydrate kinase family protein [Opitutaceae bacterium]